MASDSRRRGLRCFASAPAEAVPVPPDASVAEVVAAIDNVSSKPQEWAALPASEKKALFLQCLEIAKAEQDNLIAAACASRGYSQTSREQGHLVADAYLLSVGVVSAWIRGAITLLEALADSGNPPQGTRTVQRPDGSTRVTVFPTRFRDKLVGDTGRWTATPFGEGAHFDVIVRGEGSQFNPCHLQPSVSGVLGAGNTDICNDIVDPLCKLNSVVIYKANPVMARGAIIKARIFQPLISRGYMAILHGGAEQGKQIVESSKVDWVLMTGSSHTFDRIVWGSRDKRNPSIQPAITKPVLAELGSVNPYIVIPGDQAWSQREIEAQAEALVAYKMSNNGHICASPQVVVTCKQWPQREDFLAAVRRRVTSAPTMRCFYPGVQQLYDDAKATINVNDDVSVQAAGLTFGEDHMPLLFRVGVSPDVGVAEAQKLFESEAFCPILVEVPLDTDANLKAFLPAAVDFAHDRLWGSLSATLVVDDYTKAMHQEALDAAIDSMHFGTVGINIPASAANAFPQLSWGAFPGHTTRDVQSGIGQLGNFGCYENIEKSIMVGRFRNLLQFTNTGDPEYQCKRGRRLAEVLTHMTYWRVVKFASANFLNM